MIALAIAAMICWVMVFVARPRKPLPGNEVQELVYARLLGRQQPLALLALLVTGMTLLIVVVSLPGRVDRDLHTVRQAHAACDAARDKASDALDYGMIVRPHCYVLQPGGGWVEQVERSDGSSLIVATLASPPLFTGSTTTVGTTAYHP